MKPEEQAELDTLLAGTVSEIRHTFPSAGPATEYYRRVEALGDARLKIEIPSRWRPWVVVVTLARPDQHEVAELLGPTT